MRIEYTQFTILNDNMTDEVKERIKWHRSQIIDHNKNIQLLSNSQNRSATFIQKQVLTEVSKKYRVGEFEIIGRNRSKQLMPARKEFARIMRSKYGYTYESIGKYMSNRNHASIIYLCKRQGTK